MNADKIMEIRYGPHLYDSALKSALSWLAADLAVALDQEVTVQDFWFDRYGAVDATCQITATSVRPPFALSWDAVLALTAYANKPPSVRVTLFLFSGGDRLGRFVDYGSSYLRMRWDDAQWSAPIWFGDVYGEWENSRVTSKASEVVSQRVSLAASEIGTCVPKGPFAAEWTLTTIPDAPDQGRVELSILGERVGRLVDGGKSHIAVTCRPSGEWLVEGWRAED